MTTTAQAIKRGEEYITRAELQVAFDEVARKYGGNGTRESDLVSDVLIALWEAIK